MEFHQVRYFLAVCETRSFTRAAARCHVSQPALTTAVKKLEQELGGALFDRDPSGAKLTPLGRAVHPRFQRLAAESDGIAAAAESHLRLYQVPLRCGVLSTIGPSRLARYLAIFRARAPGVEIELHIETLPELRRKLEEGALDVLIANLGASPPEDCVLRGLYEERYLVVLPPGHPLGDKPAIALSDLSGEPYVDRLACELRDEVGRACTAASVELYPSYRTGREEWVQSLVQAGLGFAFMPEHSVQPGETIQRPLVAPAITRTISLARAASRPLESSARLFWETLLGDG